MLKKSANMALHLMPTPALFSKFCANNLVYLFCLTPLQVGTGELSVRNAKKESFQSQSCGEDQN